MARKLEYAEEPRVDRQAGARLAAFKKGSWVSVQS